jgi:hypothetical protein
MYTKDQPIEDILADLSDRATKVWCPFSERPEHDTCVAVAIFNNKNYPYTQAWFVMAGPYGTIKNNEVDDLKNLAEAPTLRSALNQLNYLLTLLEEEVLANAG